MTYQIKNGKQAPIIAVDCHYKKKKISPNMMIKKMIILTRLVQYIEYFRIYHKYQ
jgi:hypothetical protein